MSCEDQSVAKAVIVGAGPAGLTAAYNLSKVGAPVVVLESDPQYVGGISRTVNYKGFRFDIGGHRFFSKSREVEDFWTEVGGQDLLNRPRSSRIFYRGQFYAYPLKPLEALSKLGIFESLRCVLSFAAAQLHPTRNPKSFEDWVVNQFGRRLFEIFFKTYTEKVWGMSCQEISADWAAQRIKGLSLVSAARHALFPKKPKNRRQVVKTLIDQFRYPRQGPGMMWEACAEKVRRQGSAVLLGRRVTGVSLDRDSKIWTVTCRRSDGHLEQHQGEHLISSMPVRELVSSWNRSFHQRCRRRRAPCAIAISSPWVLLSMTLTASPITGSTSTIPACRLGAYRITSPGRRRWFRIPRIALTVLNISVLKVTVYGPRLTGICWSLPRRNWCILA